ncbi:hypothetical protein DYB36_001608 [Aphanomyces astaci]|uniref:V-SNARE coiled-coil homology domain-containing protein n=1 Tax=Aphanomyces astaci TaxID=112090 RepID=A0A397AHY2_APHAT|nr:hypothetical protein DYB36_001608 [Aphanomyces astaci]
MASKDDVKFLAIMRVADKLTVSTYTHAKVKADERSKYTDISKKVVSSPSWVTDVGRNSRHALDFEALKLHFMLDAGEFVYFAVTVRDYPLRVAHVMLNDLQAQFTATYVVAALALKAEHTLGSDCVKMLGSVASKYEDVTQVDKLAKVKAQVEGVKDTMKDSINIALNNTEKMDTLSQKAADLADSASVFKKGATDMRRQMWWKNAKVSLAIALSMIMAILVLLYALGIFDHIGQSAKSTYAHTKKDKEDSPKYVDMLSKVLRAPTWKQQVTPNSRHTLDCDPNKFHFTMDNDEMVYCAITAADYPIRLAFKLITAVQEEVSGKHGTKLAQAKENGLDCGKSLGVIATMYDDRTKVDKVSEVMAQVDAVKSTMQDNIQVVLSNTEKMELVEQKSNDLNEQAKVFRNAGKSLARTMWWKNVKMMIAIGLLVVLVIISENKGDTLQVAPVYYEYGNALLSYAEATASVFGKDTVKTDEGEEEDENDLEVAWEMLEVSRVLLAKHEGEDPRIDTELARVYVRLGDLSMESDLFSQARSDYERAIALHQKHLVPLQTDTTPLADIYCCLAITCIYEYAKQPEIDEDGGDLVDETKEDDAAPPTMTQAELELAGVKYYVQAGLVMVDNIYRQSEKCSSVVQAFVQAHIPPPRVKTPSSKGKAKAKVDRVEDLVLQYNNGEYDQMRKQFLAAVTAGRPDLNPTSDDDMRQLEPEEKQVLDYLEIYTEVKEKVMELLDKWMRTLLLVDVADQLDVTALINVVFTWGVFPVQAEAAAAAQALKYAVQLFHHQSTTPLVALWIVGGVLALRCHPTAAVRANSTLALAQCLLEAPLSSSSSSSGTCHRLDPETWSLVLRFGCQSERGVDVPTLFLLQALTWHMSVHYEVALELLRNVVQVVSVSCDQPWIQSTVQAIIAQYPDVALLQPPPPSSE